ncbi:MAG: T9SS type A sorting domain-containing protein, partial [Porphyromonadaceae bacterium]|nr:T9SS type A sorting domain-containing protein [Porphyromonadaceae bacterium]
FCMWLLLLTGGSAADDGLLAFPGAEGYGRFARGARASSSPTVYHVTNLNDSGTGSFRDAVSEPNRIIVFDVSGIIKISSRIVFSKNLTVAGQTAPGSGVVVYGDGVTFSNCSDLIVRYMRFRMGSGGTSGKDAAGTASGQNMIFDHCSVSWGRDETFSINADGKNGGVGDITIQKTIISQGLLPHSAGGLCQPSGDTLGVTLYRNFYADNNTRNHKVKGLNQYINNVVYNWGSGGGYNLGGDSAGSIYADVEGNYFVRGQSGSGNGVGSGNELTYVYQRGNKTDTDKDGTLNGRDMTYEDDFSSATAMSSFEELNNTIPSGHVQSEIPSMSETADEALAWIIDSVGACVPDRDEVDEYVINELLTYGLEGALISEEGALALNNKVGNFYTGDKPLDSDNDGIPDDWETENGLDPTDASDAVTYADNGYLWIENYVNSLVDNPVPFLKYPISVATKTLSSDSATVSFKCRETAEGAKIRVELKKTADEDDAYTVVDNLDVSATLAVFNGLEAKTSYTVRFTTYTEEMESHSVTLSFTTKGVAGEPEISTDPYPANGDYITEYTSVTMSFSNETEGRTTTYTIYLGTSPEQLDSLTSSKGKTCTIAVEENTTYYWRVDATNSYGTTVGDVWSFTTGTEPVRTKVLYFSFDEGAGSVAENVPSDDEIVANDAYPNDNYTPDWTDGIVNGAISFSAANTSDAMVVDSYDEIVFGTSPFSYELWFNSTVASSSQSRYLLHKGSHTNVSGTDNTGQWFGLEYKNGYLYFAVDDDVEKSVISTTGTSYFDGNWHHVVAVRDVENLQLLLYIDGELKVSGTDNTGGIEGEEALAIGNDNVLFDSPFIGLIDEFSLYSDALTAEEVKSKYEKGLTSGFRSISATASGVSIYPNPVRDNFTLTLPSADGTAKVEIYSLSGVLVYGNTLSVSGGILYVDGLEGLSSGVYTCRVEVGGVVNTARLMKY